MNTDGSFSAAGSSEQPTTKLAQLKNDLRQLKLLLWKNFLIQKRSKIGTLMEIIVPTIFVMILLPIRTIVKSEYFPTDTVFEEFNFSQLPPELKPHPPAGLRGQILRDDLPWTFAYQPNSSDLANRIMLKVGPSLGMNIIGFQSEAEMVEYLRDPVFLYERLGGVSFRNDSAANFTYAIRLSYAPRNSGEAGKFKLDTDWKTQFVYDLLPVLGPREKESPDGGLPGYRREGFLAIQNAIDMAFISESNSSVQDVDIKLRRFPFPPYNDDQLVIVVQTLLPFMTVLSFIYTVIITAKSIVHEKETGLKEAMKLMGMKPWIYWLSWYIRTMVMLIPALIFIVVSYKVKIELRDGGKASIIDKTDPFLLGLFLLLYASSSITFTFLCTTFFKKANSAAAGAGIIWFFSYLPYIFISLRYAKMTLFDKMIALLINNLALSEGIQLIGQFEGKGTGVNFHNWTSGASVDDNFSMIIVFLFMFFNNFTHIGLMAYFDQLFPGDHSIAKPWYFPFLELRAVLFPNLDQKKKQEDKTLSFATPAANTDFKDDLPVYIEDESMYSSKKVGISIKNLKKNFKQFGTIKTAVDNLSLNIYEQQISVLLGHNGAGKSTTISMITGLAEPTSGKIFINDLDIVTQTKQARKFIGFCPQFNLLFDDLTVYEHLKFFAKLKNNFDEDEIDKMLEIINLADKKYALSKTLSGGMKRKLSVSIAFIGHSSIVILDEPSSGMDPQARHSTWSLLQKFKKERKCTILLTTHFMDEADFLGDRIAIMSKGRLRCCGSPLFLKSKYSSGYNLVLTKKPPPISLEDAENEATESNSQQTDDEIAEKIASLIKTEIPEVTLNENLKSEISFVLPAQQSAKFSDVFEELEKNKDSLRIDNIGISISTLEDVFLKIGNMENIEEPTENGQKEYQTVLNHNQTAMIIEKSVNCLDTEKNLNDTYGLWIGSQADNLVFGFAYVQQLFKALFNKRLIHSLRNKGLVISQIFVPLGVLLIDLLYIKYGPVKAEDAPMLVLGLNSYRDNFVPYQVNLTNQTDPARVNQIEEWAKMFSRSVDVYTKSKSFPLENTTIVDVCQKSRGSIDEFISCVARLNNQYIYPLDTYILAGEFILNENVPKIVGHFNNQPLHVPPLILNLITNALYKYFTNSSTNTITVINDPLPRRTEDEITDLQLKDSTGFNIASGTSFGFSFLVASFAIFVIKERVSKSKHIQFLSGCNSVAFWVSAFIWDMFNYIITVIFVLILIKVFGITEFIGDERWVYVLAMLLLYGLSHIPQMYLLSNLFEVSATGFASLVALNVLTSQATLTPVQILTLPQLNLVNVSEILEWIFIVLFPNFSIGQGLADLYSNYQTAEFCRNMSLKCPIYPNPCCLNYNRSNPNRCGPNGTSCAIWTDNFMTWDRPGLLRFFVFMPLQFLFMFGVILLTDAGFFRWISYKLFRPRVEIDSQQKQLEQEYGDIRKDEDVSREERRIATMVQSREFEYDTKKEIFIIDRLTKYYSGFMAVKGISFALREAECFGLLGVNGAGKTTTFKMITGDEMVTSGDAFLNKVGLKNHTRNFQQQLGYCPQFDPLIDQMTVMETMRMFANIRGIRKELIEDTCQSLVALLDLSEHKEKMCYTLSGGNKRKLSVAISLVGSPCVVLLDEPTSGMDPKTRRTLWNCLNKIRSSGKSLILTTHSMDETEVLCTNIGIMVNGELKCLGSLQHLKSKYGEGYTLLAKIHVSDGSSAVMTKTTRDLQETNEARTSRFVAYILNLFPSGELKECRDSYVNIHIKDNSSRVLSKLFATVEECKERFSIEYYVVTQTNLEQIFLNFASRQIDPETRVLKKSRICSCC